MPLNKKPLDGTWRKASASSDGGSCMIVRRNGDNIEVADDKNHPDKGGATLSFTQAEWAAAQDGFSKGEFNL